MEEIIKLDESEFPNGLRVLLVDDSIVCLRIIAALLIKCGYQVTAKENSAEALRLLRQNENHFDIVLTNVHMHEFDGFKLLEAGLELDIPVIMMSASDSREIIMKGVRHGARDYLLKPLRMEEIKNIWQHVYRKKLSYLDSTSTAPAPAPALPAAPVDDVCEETTQNQSKSVKKMTSKRKGAEVDEEEGNQSKQERVRWTLPLHDKFVDAVTKLGGVDKAVPKKILDMMGAPDIITREKVASHLQKYRKIIKTRIELEGRGKSNNNSYNCNYNNNHHHPAPPPPPPPPYPPIGMGNSMVMGPTMRAMFAGPTMAASNYQRQLNNLLMRGGYPQALQVLPSQVMQQQPQPQPRMHLDDQNLVVTGSHNPLLAQFNNHQHHVQQPNPQECHQDLKGYDSKLVVEGNEVLDQQPSVIDPSFDQFELNNFFDGVGGPSLFEDL